MQIWHDCRVFGGKPAPTCGQIWVELKDGGFMDIWYDRRVPWHKRAGLFKFGTIAGFLG